MDQHAYSSLRCLKPFTEKGKGQRWEGLGGEINSVTHKDYLHSANFCKVSKRRFFGANSKHLWRSHDKLFLFAGHHVWVLLSHDVKHPSKQLNYKQTQADCNNT